MAVHLSLESDSGEVQAEQNLNVPPGDDAAFQFDLPLQEPATGSLRLEVTDPGKKVD